MIMKKWKLFWKLGDINKHLICKPFNENEEYYSFLKRQFDNGYRQVIVSSEAMIELIKYSAISLSLKISKIEFTEDDPSLSEDVAHILDAVETCPLCFNTLIEKLLFLSETSSIDIKRIYISGRSKNKTAISFYVQSNGIIAISNNLDSESHLLNDLGALIERCLFG